MFDYRNILNQGSIREEMRVYKLRFCDPEVTKDQKLLKLQEKLDSLDENAIIFSFKHKAEFDYFGNQINHVYLEENTKARKDAIKDLKEKNEILKEIPDDVWNKYIDCVIIDIYETKYVPKARKLF